MQPCLVRRDSQGHPHKPFTVGAAAGREQRSTLWHHTPASPLPTRELWLYSWKEWCAAVWGLSTLARMDATRHPGLLNTSTLMITHPRCDLEAKQNSLPPDMRCATIFVPYWSFGPQCIGLDAACVSPSTYSVANITQMRTTVICQFYILWPWGCFSFSKHSVLIFVDPCSTNSPKLKWYHLVICVLSEWLAMQENSMTMCLYIFVFLNLTTLAHATAVSVLPCPVCILFITHPCAFTLAAQSWACCVLSSTQSHMNNC